jgi:hypothetical protein
MSKVAIAGNASGTGVFTIAAPNSNSDRTLDLPDAAGTLDRLNRAGNVLQVVQATYAVETSTTSTSFVSSNLSGSITPSSTNSKVLVFARTGGRTNPGSAVYTIFRGTVSGTNLGNGNSGMALLYTGGDVRGDISLCYLDSPATTSSQTYTLAMRSPSASTVIAQENNGTAVMVLMEIAG